ncbi:TPA: [acyl-carrier-protein] S-malonyltransferase [bacterium]|nr:[acyl-carrier-protein] S-malonyltransferase [bacterium]
MERIAWVFPGQGSQYVGMGKEIYENYKDAKDIFDEASSVLGYNVARFCFEGPLEFISQTEYAQPLIFTVSIAYLKVLPQNFQFPIYVAGHSLGEYSALVAADVLNFLEDLRIVQKRAALMKEFAEKEDGGMSACLGLPIEKIEEISKETDVEIANINSKTQIVISGKKSNLKRAEEIVKSLGGKAIRLKTQGSFHSSLMRDIGINLGNFLESFEMKKPKIKIVQNTTGRPTDDPNSIRQGLIDQVSSKVQWEKTMSFMRDEKIKTIIEIGPGKVLSNLIKREFSEISAISVDGMLE